MLEIHFGTGGTDSKIFVGELFSAYQKYAAKKHFKLDILQDDSGHVLASIKGQNVFKAFASETGQHVCQRVPVTERNGRKQTSLVSVAVLPIREETDYTLDMSEVDVICQRKGGPGGQNVNKVASAVRMKHIPSGLSVFINGRDQGQNKEKAFQILQARVGDHYRAINNTAYATFRRDQLGDGHRGSKIRTYNFIQSFVKDHRVGAKTSRIWEVMNGDFEHVMG